MTYFIHKTASGTAPQSGYERLSVYRNPTTGAIWVLWRTSKTPAEITEAIKGELHIIGQAPDADILAIYPDLIPQKRSRIRAEGAKRLTQIAGEYNAEERETWEQQRQEAEAYMRDGELAETPMLTAFAAGRGIPLATLAQGILDNAAAFKVASGQVMGQMYALIDQVNGLASSSLDAALNVEW